MDVLIAGTFRWQLWDLFVVVDDFDVDAPWIADLRVHTRRAWYASSQDCVVAWIESEIYNTHRCFAVPCKVVRFLNVVVESETRLLVMHLD